MKVSRLKIAEVIGKRTLGVYEPKKLAREIAAYLLSDGRVDELDSLIRDIIAYRASQGILEVRLTSAHQLSNQLKTEVKRLVRSYKPATKTVILSEITDKQLIGGIKLGLANLQLDLSLRAKLNRFKQLTNAGKA